MSLDYLPFCEYGLKISKDEYARLSRLLEKDLEDVLNTFSGDFCLPDSFTFRIFGDYANKDVGIIIYPMNLDIDALIQHEISPPNFEELFKWSERCDVNFESLKPKLQVELLII